MAFTDSQQLQNESPIKWSLWFAVGCQLATIAITWPLWQIRSFPPLLPILPSSVPQWNFGWLMVVSCLFALVRPWLGGWVHLVVMLIACVFDEMRTQPQFFAIWVFMLVAAQPKLEPIAKWFVISMWIWAGTHKLISPDWLSHSTTDLLVRVSLDPITWHWPFAIGIALSEILSGLVAIVAPKKAAYLCVLMHVGIILFLSPLGLDWNYSVFPWNLATAVLGFDIFRRSEYRLPKARWEFVAASLLMLYPAGFYLGWVDHGISFVFYSGNTPYGLVCQDDSVQKIRGWTDINVPFPNERRLLRRYFEAVAKPGDKLHIQDPRWFLDDQFFLMVDEQTSKEISEQEFRGIGHSSGNASVVRGFLLDDYVALWHLGRRGARMLKRTEDSMIYAIEIPPEAYSKELIPLIKRVPNLEQLQLAGTAVIDAELSGLLGHPSIVGLGLSNTKITNQSLPILKSMPNLRFLEVEGSGLDTAVVNEFLDERKSVPTK